jgi:GGDEF domain-containing protein
LTTTSTDPIAVIFVDLVRFKTVNDTHGHLIGDQLPGITGRRLLAPARHADRVGRLGGDEFLLVCHGVADPPDALPSPAVCTNTCTVPSTSTADTCTSRPASASPSHPGSHPDRHNHLTTSSAPSAAFHRRC